jgi:hypothetical protein
MADLDRQQVISGIQKTLKDLLFTETEVFYFHLESLGVKRDEILDKPEKFVRTIHDIFGNGAPLVESALLSEVSRQLNVESRPDLEGTLRVLCERSR